MGAKRNQAQSSVQNSDIRDRYPVGSSRVESYEEWEARVHPRTTPDINGFLDGTQKFLEDVHYQNYRSAMGNYDTLLEQRNAISNYLDQNLAQVDSETYREFKNLFQAFDNAGQQVQDYRGRLSYDLEAGQAGINNLKNDLQEYRQLLMDASDNPERFEQLKGQYGSLSDLQALITQSEVDYNLANRTQRQYAMGNIDPSRPAYDLEAAQSEISQLQQDYEDFRRLMGTNSADPQRFQELKNQYGNLTEIQNLIQEKEAEVQNYDPYNDVLYNYINNPDLYREMYQMQDLLPPADPLLWGIEPLMGIESDPYKYRGYDRLTDAERDMFNYHYQRGGQEEAQQYLDSIQDTLNIRQADEIFQNLQDKTALEILFGIDAGIDNFQQSTAAFFNTEDDYIPYSAKQYASGMVREDLADAGPVIRGNSLGQIGYDIVNTSANMAPSILASTALSILAPPAGPFVGSGMMGLSAAGSAYQQALNAGFNKDQARLYGNAIGASEAIMSYLLAGIGKLGGKATNNVLAKILSKVDSGFLRAAGMLGGKFASEGLEEGLQDVVSPIISNAILHTDEDIDWESVGYSGFLGGITALLFEGGPTIYREVNTSRIGRDIIDAGAVESLRKAGTTFSPDSVAYRLANKVNENTDAYTIGRLFNEVNASFTEQNIQEITQALVKERMPETIARKNAEVMARIVDGEKITATQAEVIRANEPLAKAVRTTLIDPNATWFQRTQSFSEVSEKLDAFQESKEAPKPKQTATDNTADGTVQETAEKPSTEEPKRAVQFKEIGKKDATVILEDGTEAPLDTADIDPDEAVVLETIAGMDGITVQDANFMLGALNVGHSPESTGTLRHMAGYGAREAFQYGYYGAGQEQISQYGSFANSLTKAQQDAIYNLGKQAGQRAAQQKQAEVKAAPTTTTGKKPGKVHMEGSRKGLTQRQRTSLKALDRIADVMGIQIYIYESKVTATGKRSGENGWYNPSDGSIHIDLFAGQNGEGTILFTAAHELTHFIRQWSPEKFKVLADFLIEQYGKKGISLDSLIHKQQDKARRNGRELSYDDAYEEVIADSMETMLSDTKVMEKLAILKQQDQTLWEKIRSYISQLAEKIREVYKGMKPDTQEGQYVAEMVDALDRIQQLFAEGLADASGNYQSEENIAKESAILRSERIVEQVRRALPHIMKIDPVYTIDEKNASTYTSIHKEDEAIGRSVFRTQGGFAFRPGFGRVVLGRKGIVDTVFHGNGPAKQASVPAIKAVIEQGVEIGSDKNHKQRGYDTVTFAAPVNFFGTESVLGVVVKIYDNGRGDKSFYIHEIFDAEGNYIELLNGVPTKKEISSTGEVDSSSTAGTADNGIAPKNSIRDERGIVNTSAEENVGIEVNSNTDSVAPAIKRSERTWTESDYVQERDKAAEEIAKAIGVTKKKALDYIDSVNGIAKMIAEDRTRLDYFSSPYRSSFVSNVEYGGSFDFSTLCKKRRLLTGTFTAIQRALPNTALTANEILDIRNRMKDAGLEVSCGLCYVEGSRANMGQFAKEFLRLYKQYYPDAWQPNMADVNTPEGIEWVRINHPEVYEQYEYFWNHYGTLKAGDKNLFASQQKPKLYQLHTEYKGEILQKFRSEDNIEAKNRNGGIRLQSFSDFEIVHLIDTMQIIMDMSRVGLAGQAYTKVPDFAWALGDTGLKINLSLIAKGVDEHGRLIFDNVEGMPIGEAMALRDRYSKNVGTILVAFNDEQLRAAMADDRVDFIIPFHRSQWKKSQYTAMELPAKTKDYTYMYCSALNVPRDVYLDICRFVNNTENDVDPENGASVRYSAVKKIMAEIDSYPLSPAQKTAVAQSIGEIKSWKDSTIRKYKLW